MTDRLLLDVDPGIDDALAILMAAGSDAVELTGVTTVAGNTTVENATENARSVLTLAGRSDVPVAAGCDRPLQGEHVGAEHVHGPGGLPAALRSKFPDPEGPLVETHAAQFLVDRAREYGEDLSLCFVGPPTNLAVALLLEPDLADLVGDVYLLAGAIYRTGNVTPAASFNAYSDPAATERALDATPKLVPLDVSERGILERSTLDAFEAAGGVPALATELLEAYTVEQVRRKWDRDGAIASDTVLVADVLADVLDYERGYVTVETADVSTRGATVYDEHGKHDGPPNAEVALEVDVDAYRETVASTLRAVDGRLD